MRSETFRFQLGSFSCLAIMDDAVRYPIGMFLTNLAREKYEPLLRQRGQSTQEIDLPYICLFINTGRERVLVDTGIGVDGMGPASGKLLSLLRAEGIEPHEIGTVILSHGHPDHIGGSLNEDGKPAFPNARYRDVPGGMGFLDVGSKPRGIASQRRSQEDDTGLGAKELIRGSSATRSRASGHRDRPRHNRHRCLWALTRPDGARNFVDRTAPSFCCRRHRPSSSS